MADKKRFTDPTLSFCAALEAQPHHPKGQCPKTTSAVAAASTHHHNNHRHGGAGCRNSYAAVADGDSPHHHHRVPFENLDPNSGNDEAAAEILRVESGAIAREVTQRLTEQHEQRRNRELERIRAEHCIKRKVAIRDEAHLRGYVAAMIRRGEERRQKELRRIEAEMYPKPFPKITKKSQQLVSQRRSVELSQGKPITRVEDRYKTSPRRSAATALHPPPRSSSQRGTMLRREPSFKPAGVVVHTDDLFLTSRPSPRCPSPRPSQPLSEAERLERFVALSQPRRSQSASRVVPQ